MAKPPNPYQKAFDEAPPAPTPDLDPKCDNRPYMPPDGYAIAIGWPSRKRWKNMKTIPQLEQECAELLAPQGHPR